MKFFLVIISFLALALMLHPTSAFADTQRYLVICAPENTAYTLDFITPERMTINGGPEISYHSYFAFVVGNPVTGYSTVAMHGYGNTNFVTTVSGTVPAGGEYNVYRPPALSIYKTAVRRVSFMDLTDITLLQEIPKSCYKKLQ